MIGKGIIPKRIRERGVNDMKIKVVRSLLLVATVLSIGVSSVPVMAVDISPDTDISVDADDSSAVAPDDSGTTVSPDNNGTSVTPDNPGSVITPDNQGTVIAPDNGNGITPDNPQQVVTPTPVPSISGSPENGVPQVTWDFKYDDTSTDGNYGYVKLKPSVTEGGHIVCAYKVDGQWGRYLGFTGTTSMDGEAFKDSKLVQYTDSMDTWTVIYTDKKDIEANDVAGADSDGYFTFDLNNALNHDIPGDHNIEFYYYYWFDDLKTGSEVYKYPFTTTFEDGHGGSDEDTSTISINASLKSQNAWSKTYSIQISCVDDTLLMYTFTKKTDEDYYYTSSDCKGYQNYSFEKTFSTNGTYTLMVMSEGSDNFYSIDVSGIDEGAVPDDGDDVSGDDVVVAVPKLSVSGVPAAGSVNVGQTINLVVTSDKVCTLSGDNIENPVDGTSVTVPVSGNGTYEFFGTLSNGTYGRTTVNVNCFKDGSSTSGGDISSSSTDTKSYSSLEDFWGSQLNDKLPQTGTIGLSSVLGLGIAGMASGLVLMRRKKKDMGNIEKEDEDNEE